MTLKLPQILSIVILLTAVIMGYADTVDDLDLWWHLKSGEVMYESGAVLSKDPFAYTSYIPEQVSSIGKSEVDAAELPNDANNRIFSSDFIKRNWLSQLILYFFHAIAGNAGIGYLKSFLFAGTFCVLYLAMKRHGAGHAAAFLVLCLTAYAGADFNYTRPQIFSYFLLACTLFTLHDFKRGGKSIYLLPLIVLAWANLHGAFVLGVILILAAAAAESIKYALNSYTGLTLDSALTGERLKILLGASAASLVASLISHGGYSAYIFPFIMKNSIFATIEEYHRPMLYEYHSYWFMLGLVVLSLLIRAAARRLDLTDLCIACVLIVPSLRSNKYIIYFMLGASIFLASSLTYFGAALGSLRPLRGLTESAWIAKMRSAGLSGIFALIASLVILFNVATSGSAMKLDAGEKRYPTGAAEFIRDNSIQGNMFNTFNWGGYLAWTLYPDHKVFIYGRAVNETALFHYRQIIKAANGENGESPLWKRLLNAYDVDIVLVPAVSSNGKIIGLVDRLYPDPGWELIYADGKSLLFMRASDENRGLIHNYHMSKEKIYDEIISECLQGIADAPATWGYYETLGYIYMKQYRVEEASKMFEKYLSMNPNNKDVQYYYNLTKQYKGSQHGSRHTPQ